MRLEWDALHGMESETRLRQLARWLLLAEAQGLKYGLSIPGSKVEPGRGDVHLHQCLRALAVFDHEKEPAAPLPLRIKSKDSLVCIVFISIKYGVKKMLALRCC